MMRRNFVVPVLILLNIGVYLLWQTANPDLFAFLVENFTVSWTGLLQGRWWTTLSSEFSHNYLLHIFLNMFVLRSFGGLLEGMLGWKRFLSFYIVAAIVASITHASVSAFLLHEPELPAVGASGAIAGLVLLFSLMFPREKILIFGLIPLPAMFGALVFVGLDVWGLVAQAEGGGLPIGHGAHLGGALTGVLFYYMVVRRHWRRQKHLYE